jgi:hypothetical protein
MDLYGWDEGNSTWRWTGTSHPKYPDTQSKMASVTCKGACQPRAYRLHLPTYMATSDVSIGVDSAAASVRPDSSHIGKEKPIVWYGTSILQGGVASRPGQVNTHIVSRALETEIFNFGFSGNGIMELSVAQYLTEIDASMIIVDCNCEQQPLLSLVRPPAQTILVCPLRSCKYLMGEYGGRVNMSQA